MNILILSAFPEEHDYYKRTLHSHASLKIGFIEVLSCQADRATIYLATTGMGTINAALVLATLVWALFAIYFFGLKLHIETGAPTYAWIIYANIPYLLWVSFATILQLTITFLNK